MPNLRATQMDCLFYAFVATTDLLAELSHTIAENFPFRVIIYMVLKLSSCRALLKIVKQFFLLFFFLLHSPMKMELLSS